MVDNDVGNRWLEFWDRTDRERVAAKDSPGVVRILSDAYRGLSDADRPNVDAVLVDALSTGDEGHRFDALALIHTFRIRSALPGLHDLSKRLGAQSGPSARYELAKVKGLIDWLLEP